MKSSGYLVLAVFFICIGCKKREAESERKTQNSVEFADGLEIRNYGAYTVMKVTKPWPEATRTFTYVCAKSKEHLPDSLAQYTFVQTPVQKIVVSSTTHIASLVALKQSDKLIGFPHLEYISSPEVRNMIATGKIEELSDQESLNFEKTIDLGPQVIVGLSMDNETSKFNQFEKAGIPVLYNADWVETSPLGKAEWVKFFGVLFDREQEADLYFKNIVSEYEKAKQLVSHVKEMPTVLSGSVFQDVWYAPQGESWMAAFIRDAKGTYIWGDTKGIGSLSLSIETVLEKGIEADFWIGPGQFTTYSELGNANKHYREFRAFQQHQVYSYSLKKGPSGGLIFYEDAPNRPDQVLKDLIYILHPEVLPQYHPVFIEALR